MNSQHKEAFVNLYNMLKGKIIKRLLLATLAVLALATYKGWILWPYFYEHPYYKISASDFKVINHKESDWARIIIRNNVALRLVGECPMSENWYQDTFNSSDYNRNCRIRIFLEGPVSNKIKFENHSKFKVEGFSLLKKSFDVDINATVYETKEEWAWITFKNEVRPKKFRLYIPELKIGSEVIEVPVITGKYVHRIKFIPFSF